MTTTPANLALVGAGGALGAIARYVVGLAAHRGATPGAFPWGTLAVNLAGCLLIGLGAGLADTRGGLPAEARLFLFVGVLGGFTTFSSFGYETFTLLREQHLLRAALNAGLNVAAGLLLVALGHALGSAGRAGPA